MAFDASLRHLEAAAAHERSLRTAASLRQLRSPSSVVATALPLAASPSAPLPPLSLPARMGATGQSAPGTLVSPRRESLLQEWVQQEPLRRLDPRALLDRRQRRRPKQRAERSRATEINYLESLPRLHGAHSL
eukprot:5278943-Pleurochrysis_carterae.AAC.2